MFAKIFSQIYDSSIVENTELRFTFMDMLVLADCNGVVDMTHEAIARRTNRPIDVIRKTITGLEAPDSKSRTPDFDGARIKRLDEHRDWGWMIVNYEKFRQTASEEQRREKTLARVHKHRGVNGLPKLKRSVTPCNARNAMQKQREKQKHMQKEEEEIPLLLNTEAFRSAWEDWKAHRREIKKPLTSTSIKSQLAQFEEWGEQRAVAAIRHTIRKGWQGIREDDARNGSTQPVRREKIDVPITRFQKS